MTTRVGRGWFGSVWLAQTVQFAEPSSSWRIIQKLQEHETVYPQDEYNYASGYYSESIGIFVCGEIGSSTQAILKIRMQIPNSVDDPSSSHKFIQPAKRDICDRTSQEIEALRALTNAGCSCTPRYITSKHACQNLDSWVPDGFLDYIVMEKLEGVALSNKYFSSLQPKEQKEIRTAFKSSYEECQKLSFFQLDTNISNLIWDKQKRKCYIVDWELWVRKAYPWVDYEYQRWGLF